MGMIDTRPKDRTCPCYEVALRGNLKVVDRAPKPTSPKSISLDEFESYVTFAIDELEQFRDAPYVMMENKKVWFDRETGGIFPRFEAVELPSFATVGRPLYNYAGWTFEGFTFLPMTPEECLRSFVVGMDNPYLDEDGNFKYFPTALKKIILVSGWKGNKSYCITSSGQTNIYSDSDKITMVPIYRLNGVNARSVQYGKIISAWLTYELIPEGLSPEAKKAYTFLMKIFPNIQRYVRMITRKLTLDFNLFKHEAQRGIIDFESLVAKGLGKIKNDLPNVKAKKDDAQNPINQVRAELCQCDYIRANIEPYDAKILTDPKGGHWELFEEPPQDAEIIELPEGEPFFGRPPQMDVTDGIVAIDFGTKATVVVRQVGVDEKLLRIGEGNYSKAPEKKDYENPTVIELRDYESFKAAYLSRDGRPFTQWDDATFSHTAAAVLNDAEKDTSIDSSVFYSVFGELKQWANDKDLRMYLQDRKKKLVELNPYLQLEDDDFDPIELYAYYLGLYINNMHTGICLEYMFSFPVTYEKAVREKILESFERGIKKSLPPAILNDDELMENFTIYAGASEPAAYASCALGELKLQPKGDGKTAYAVFDFGGGTTDFDFGIESVDPRRRFKFVINQYTDTGSGDPYLGGENLLNIIAYEVYKNNLSIIREKQIPFALPYECIAFDGSETLLLKTKEAYVNRKRIAEFLRPFWEENIEESNELFDTPRKLKLYSKTENKIIPVELKLNKQRLEECLTERIRRGVDNFFEALLGAFKKPEVLPIHILLAGNSCKSSIVRNLFEEKIRENEQKLEEIISRNTGEDKKVSNIFVLHMPLGFDPDEADKKAAEIHDADEDNQEPNQSYERLRTGKTGVAFGLLRSREGGRDVKIVGGDKQAPFPFYMGEIDDDDCFQVKVKLDIPYKQWTQFTFADVQTFEVYFTKEARAISGKLKRNEVNVIRCKLDKKDLSDEDDVFVYIRKATPDTIEYAVGRAEDFEDADFGGTIYSKKFPN
ncbi:MAG: hypothetical protein IJK81_07065 [Selenomonadaceae bacterium]|nr:hypothetical protein [Selenomonadaceae bacterium]